MAERLHVVLLYGGRSAEHDISRISARFVAEHLDPARYDVTPVLIRKDGTWLLPDGGRRALQATAEPAGRAVVPASTRSLLRTDGAVGAAPSRPVDVVFPVLHGPHGEDGTVQGFLELAGIPYVGCGVLGSALGMDKAAQKDVLRAHGIPTPRHVLVRRSAWRTDPAAEVRAVESAFRYPVFVKPANLGSSVGISKARDASALRAALDLAGAYDQRLIVEESIEEAREIECGVIGNDVPEASAVGELRTRRDFYDYEAKYLDPEATDLSIPADLPEAVSRRVRDMACRTFLALDGAGMARVDFFLRQDDLWVNEINTIPGFTAGSMFPRLWEAAGVPPARLLDRLVELAIERHRARRALRTDR